MPVEYIPKVWENYKTPILDEDLNHIENGLKAATDAINDEQTTRTNADNTIQQSIDNEVKARTESDKTLQTNINNEVQAREQAVQGLQTNIDNEAKTRLEADNALQTAINAEAQTRSQHDEALQTAINGESLSRSQADNDLSIDIETEANEREQADGRLQTNIDDEALTRQTEDNRIQKNIDKEAQARQIADTELQTNIDNEEQARSQADNVLQKNIDSESSERTKADNAIKESLASEKSARETADSTLQRNIESEASERETADSALQRNIENEVSARGTADSTLQSNIENEKSARETADNAINESLESHDTRLNALENLVRVNKIYGFHLDNNESDPDAKITYLEDAVGAVPAKMDYTSGAFDYGSWLNAFFMPRPCMVKYSGQVDYYLNPDNYAQKEDGTESDVANEAYEGNAMMEWGRDGKKIWMKIVPDETGASVYFSDVQVDSTYNAYAFYNKNNVLMDHFYTPIYNGYKDASGKMRSISGKALSFSLSGTAEITACTANGDGWYTETIVDRMLINMLLILISKSTSTQSVFGQGMTSGGESSMKAYRTGSLDAKGMFFGYSATDKAVKVFGMENYWGLQWRRHAGLIQKGGKAYYKLTRGTADGSTATDFNTDGTGYIEHSGALLGTSGQWQSTQAFDTNLMIPSGGGASDSTHMCDHYWVNTGATTYALLGGSSGNGSTCGAFCLNLNAGVSAAHWHLGCAPSLKPLA